MTMNEEILLLKQEIKDWEHLFTRENGLKPTHQDIKSNVEIQQKYKRYQKLKKSQNVEITTPTKKRHPNVTPTKKRVQQMTPTKSLLKPVLPLESPFSLKEIGPTPQLHGRVMSIFDIPDNSPVRSEEPKIFKTPSKKRVVVNVSGTPIRRKANILETPLYLRKNSSQIISFSESQEEIYKFGPDGAHPVSDQSPLRTPQHTPVSDFNVEPSPTFSPVRKTVKRKSLFEMMNELGEIKDEMSKYDEEELNALILEENKVVVCTPEEQDSQPSQQQEEPVEVPKHKRAKTQKRSTKRRKIKPLQNAGEDSMAGIDVLAQMQKLQDESVGAEVSDYDSDDLEHNEMILNELEDDGDSGESSEEEERVREVDTKGGFKLLNNNFVRMKIHYKNRGKFRRR